MINLDSVIELNDLYISERKGKILIVVKELGNWFTSDQTTIELFNLIKNKKTLKKIIEDISEDKEIIINKIKKHFENGVLNIDGKKRFSKPDVNALVLDQNTSPQLCILHVSNICNLACKYCYAHTDENQKKTMSIDTMKKSLDRVLELPGKELTVEFHGGEPLMQYKKINEICEYAEKVRGDKKIEFAMQSNLTFLNDEILDILKKFNIKIRVSLDGLKEINDYFRIDNEGKGSFDKIIKNLKLLNKNNIYPEVVAVITKRSIDYLPEIFDFFASINLNKIRLMPFWAQGMGNEIKEEEVEQKYLSKKYIELIDWIVKYNKNQSSKDDYIKMLVLAKELEALTSHKRSFMCLRCPCGAGINMIDISINGDIYPCEEMNEIKEFKIGNIESSSIMEAIKNSDVIKRLKERNPDKIEECSDCAWKQHCQSGCANKNYQKFGKFETKSEKCDFYKNYFENLIWYLNDNRDAMQYLV